MPKVAAMTISTIENTNMCFRDAAITLVKGNSSFGSGIWEMIVRATMTLSVELPTPLANQSQVVTPMSRKNWKFSTLGARKYVKTKKNTAVMAIGSRNHQRPCQVVSGGFSDQVEVRPIQRVPPKMRPNQEHAVLCPVLDPAVTVGPPGGSRRRSGSRRQRSLSGSMFRLVSPGSGSTPSRTGSAARCATGPPNAPKGRARFVQAASAHANDDRADLFKRRRVLMEQWADYLKGEPLPCRRHQSQNTITVGMMPEARRAHAARQRHLPSCASPGCFSVTSSVLATRKFSYSCHDRTPFFRRCHVPRVVAAPNHGNLSIRCPRRVCPEPCASP